MMDKLNLTKKSKPDRGDLEKKIGEVILSTERTKLEIQEMIKQRPIESASAIFVIGMIIGLLIARSISKR